MTFERLGTITLGALGIDEETLDGPFLMRDGSFGLLVSLRGKDGGSMPGPTELAWRRDVPARARTEPVHVFVRRGDHALYLGRATVRRRGRPARDGFALLFGLAQPVDEPVWRELCAEGSAPPPPAPEEAIASLSEASSTDDRMRAMRSFAERWFGADPDAPPLDGSVSVPLPLRELHRLLAGRDVCEQNQLVAPTDLEVVDGKLVFYIENQGVCSWGTEPDGDDPPVLVRYERGWSPEADSLSGFLIQLLVHEAVFGAPFTAQSDAIDARTLARLKRRIAPLPLPDWHTSRTRFFGSNGVIGFAYPDADQFWVWLGAKDRTRLEAIEDLVEDWPDLGF